MRYGHCRTAASIHAFTAGQATLLTGELDCLAVAVADECPRCTVPTAPNTASSTPAAITAAPV